jgi:hypothetical protein
VPDGRRTTDVRILTYIGGSAGTDLGWQAGAPAPPLGVISRGGEGGDVADDGVQAGLQRGAVAAGVAEQQPPLQGGEHGSGFGVGAQHRQTIADDILGGQLDDALGAVIKEGFTVDGEQLARVPVGYPKDHPARNSSATRR